MMSAFDDNPFSELTIDNPFADPAVLQVANNTSTTVNVEDYNPFANQHPTGYSQANNETQDPPAYTRIGQQAQLKPYLNTAELLKKQEELEAKERELARREADMQIGSYNTRHNNWPPFPEKCCFQPMFYQDIQVDIPMEFQKIVRSLYYLWMFHGMIMILNVIGGIILLNFTIIGMGIVYILMFTPFSYLCWFRPAYKAFRSDSSFNFMVFFFVFFFQFIFTTVQAIGLPGSGTIGIFIAIAQFENDFKGILRGIFALIVAGGFTCAAAADLFLISKIHRIYKCTGASFAKAHAEFSSEFFKDRHVQGAATSVVASALQSNFFNKK